MSVSHYEDGRNMILPLVLDLDGTLYATDTLVEMFIQNVFRRPGLTVKTLFSILKGRVAFKKNLAAIGSPDIASMPINEDILRYAKTYHESAGGAVHLVTAANNEIAEQVGIRYPFLETVTGTDGEPNLKGKSKAEFLQKRFPNGFIYAGNSRADLDVWAVAKHAILVGVKPMVRRDIGELGIPIEVDFPGRQQNLNLKIWLKALRIHQWSKNVLILVPLILSHTYNEPRNWVYAAIGFLLVSIVASGTYVLNDLSDLSADRRHATKKNRAFAAGHLSLSLGLFVSIVMIVGGIFSAFLLLPAFGMALMLYLIMTVSYSLHLKREPIIDVLVLAALYALRIVMGAILFSVSISSWLIAFSIFFFYSMSLAKRQTELMKTQNTDNIKVPTSPHNGGRGYYPSDAPLTLALGTAAAISAILVIGLYLTEAAFPSGAYSSPQFLWSAPILIGGWTQRIWLLAHRGVLDDDPVAFAVKDPPSIILGVVLLGSFIWAV